jgi:hypothetical protein
LSLTVRLGRLARGEPGRIGSMAPATGIFGRWVVGFSKHRGGSGAGRLVAWQRLHAGSAVHSPADRWILRRRHPRAWGDSHSASALATKAALAKLARKSAALSSRSFKPSPWPCEIDPRCGRTQGQGPAIRNRQAGSAPALLEMGPALRQPGFASRSSWLLPATRAARYAVALDQSKQLRRGADCFWLARIQGVTIDRACRAGRARDRRAS